MGVVVFPPSPVRRLWPIPGYSGPRFLSQAADLQLEMTQKPHKKPGPNDTLVFGKTFTDHMLMVEWAEPTGWSRPRIQPFQNLTLHPACSALHYSLQVARQPASARPTPSLISSLLLCLFAGPPPRVCFLCPLCMSSSPVL